MTALGRTPRTRQRRSRIVMALVVGLLTTVLAAGALAQMAKSGLIGKLEGPEVVTDPAKFPKTLNEAPQLAALVKAGKLPPVAERVGQDPLVIKPLREIGRYGGTWRAGFTGPADFWNGFRCCSGPDHLMFWDYTGDKVLPNLARGLEMQDGGRAWLLQLRRGMKWSDGKPFTADDFVFWFEDIYRNKDLIPTPSAAMAINGKQGVIEKVDTYTVRYKFPEPYFMLPDVLAGSTDLAGQMFGYRGMGGFAPAHYMKQFHPKYAGAAELDRKVKEAKFDSWVRMFLAKNDWALNPDLPVLSAWKTVTPINTPTWTLERNPYSVFVDTAGNQLPYIDRVVLTLAENLEVLNLRVVAGEYDYASRHVDLGKLPVSSRTSRRAGTRSIWIPATTAGT
jgi:peptide/nickel transport system substrate-binding protein